MSKRGFMLRGFTAGALLLAVSPAFAQVWGPNGELIYPPDMIVPRNLTPIEIEYLRRHPFMPGGARTPTPPPTGPVHCASEYEPMDGIIVAWRSFTGIHAEMGKWITTTGNANYYVAVDNTSVQSSATAALTSAGANMSRVKFMIRPVDTVWIRDYGPRYIFEGDVRGIADHQYNRPRPNDNLFPGYFSTYKKHVRYMLGMNNTDLVHGGGNYHLDSLGRGYATRLINNENPWFTEQQIVSIWQMYQNLDTVLFNPYPASIDSTQHIDMWMQVIADNKVIISDWPNNPGSAQDIIADNAAITMQNLGFTVYRVPAFKIGSVHYTYTNMVMCNDLVMIPSYTNSTVSPHNAAALATIQSALPGKTVVQINCEGIIGSAGAIHCIVMHVPKHRGLPGPFGGLAPTAYLRAPNGGETLNAGQSFQIRWSSDDDEGVSSVDLLLSTDGGASFPFTIASNIVDTGLYNWTLPNLDTAAARVRVVTRDAVGNTGSDASDASFTISMPCYANCDNSVVTPVLNVADFTCFLQKFASGDPYANCDQSTIPPVLNVADFTCFLQKFAAGCP